MKALQYKGTNIICDNKDCDYRDIADLSKLKSYINKPCPKCGSNLLTEEDYDIYIGLMNEVNIINNILGDVKVDDDTEIKEVEVRTRKGISFNLKKS